MTTSNTALSQKTLNKVFWRWYFWGQIGWNYEKMQGSGYCYAMMPALKEIYTNEDDLHVYRPGIQALKELGIVSPLAENGITKEEARQMASTLGLSVSSRPSTPCMATRLPYNTPLDVETLKRIEDGEAFLRTVLSGNIRLRLHGDVARLEVDEGAMDEVLKMRNRLVDGLKGLGFRYISLDLQGFRSGSMDV